MNKRDHRIYRLDGIEVDTSLVCLKRDGQEQHLRQKTFQVLVYLLEHRQHLVTKDELIEHVWPDTAATDNTLEQCLAEIRRVLGDDPRDPRFVKTVRGAGYRFIGAVKDVELNAGGQSTDDKQSEKEFTDPSGVAVASNAPQTSLWKSKRFHLILVVALLLTAATSFYVIQRRRERSISRVTLSQTTGKRPVAVMFFDNRSDSAELEWLREGLADMLITGLSNSKQLTVLSRQQLHVLIEESGYSDSKGISLDAALDLARRSQAKIVILGSFAKLGERIRIDVQLHEVLDGHLLAAESLVVETPAEILTQIDLLSYKLTSHFGATGDHDASAGLTSVTTNNLEAYRYYSLGVEKAHALHNQEAIELFQKAITLDPEFAMAHARIGYAYVVSSGRVDEGKPYLERAFKLTHRLSEKDKLNINAWYALANLDYAGAIRSFQQIVALHPLEIEAYRRLGDLLRGEERFEEAAEVLKQGLVIDAKAKELYNSLGLLYSEAGRHDDAIAMFQRYVALAPDEANAHDSLGGGYQWAGRYQEAIAEYQRARALKADFEIPVIHLANTYFQQGRYREAIKEYEHYLKVAPSNLERVRGYISIAYVQLARGRLDEAERVATQAEKSHELGIGPLFLTALKKGNLAAAEKSMQTLEAIRRVNRGSRGDARELNYYRGLLNLKKGRTEEAIENFKIAIKHRPPTWHIDAFEDCLANAYLELGRLDEATAEYERILRLNPNYPLVHFHLGKIYERQRLLDQARAAYRHFLLLWKDADADVPEVIAARRAEI